MWLMHGPMVCSKYVHVIVIHLLSWQFDATSYDMGLHKFSSIRMILISSELHSTALIICLFSVVAPDIISRVLIS
jgi:hypothetical protein